MAKRGHNKTGVTNPAKPTKVSRAGQAAGRANRAGQAATGQSAMAGDTQNPAALWAILLGALVLRLVLAFVTEGYTYDMSCFVAWGDKLAAEGFANFYSEGYFADYPPGYLPVLGAVGAIRAALGIGSASRWTYLLLAVVPTLCDVALAFLVWQCGRRWLPNPRAALAVTAFVAFNPLLLFDTAIWKQIDSAFALPLVLCFWLLEQAAATLQAPDAALTPNPKTGRYYLAAALCYGIALAIKPQALLLGPVLAVCFLAGVCMAPPQARLRAVLRCLGGAAVALAPVLVIGLPFFGAENLLPGLLSKYLGTASSYPYASINAFNLFAALGGNWQPQTDLLFGVIPWQTLGTLNIIILTTIMAALAVRAGRAGRLSPLLLAAFYGMGVFTMAHCMHERYLIPAVVLTLLAAVRCNDMRLYGAGFGLSLTGFVNLATVYSLVGSDDEWLTSTTSDLVVRFTGLAETACFALLCFTVWDIVAHGGHTALAPLRPLRELSARPAGQPAWTRRELLGMAALTAVTAVLSFGYLGEMTAPQQPLDATDTTVSVAFTPEQDVAEVWVYPGISYGGSLTITDESGQTLFTKELDYGTCFSWATGALNAAAGQTLTATVDNAQVFELSLRGADGTALAVQGGGALLDEQALVPAEISQLNSMYFDEIYHGRTGYEQLHGLRVYETTHPPLGKDFIMLGIALFGMTGFGWRFAGTLFGVLLVPLAWCFARRLTRKPWVAAVAGVVLAFDFMRFAQSRIATIDIYGTFFILLGAYCMLWYCQSVLENGVEHSLLPMALGGLAFGLGCASKWTGIYNGVGLAVLYLGVLWVRKMQNQPGFWREFRTAAVGGVLFYILLPLCIYALSYLPYWWRDPGFSLQDLIACQEYMFSYHAGLDATHPFESRWYTWLLGLRPVWYYANGHLPAGLQGSIAGLAGPVIWLGGLFSLLVLFWRQVSGRGDRAQAGVLILYATQLAPWMLVSRCTFLYHYFPSSMFCLAGMALLFSRLKNEKAAKQIGVGLCVAAVLLFAIHYPALSGLPIPRWWANAISILPSFGFY